MFETNCLSFLNGFLTTINGETLKPFNFQVELLLNDNRKYDKMAREMNPYGDGKTSEKILSHIKSYFFDPVLDSK